MNRIIVNPSYSNNKNIDVEVKTNKFYPNIDVKVNNTGEDDKFFIFKQNIPSSIWKIEHDLNKYPSVTVVDSGENVVVGDIEYLNENNLLITFTASFSGKAYLN